MLTCWPGSTTTGSAFAALTRELGISKQAVSQLIDTMVMRGYLERTPDTEDRRRMLLTLTPRGSRGRDGELAGCDRARTRNWTGA